MLWYVLPPFTISGTFVLSHYEQVYRTQEVCISELIFIRLFSLFWWTLSPLKIFDTFLNTLYKYSGKPGLQGLIMKKIININYIISAQWNYLDTVCMYQTYKIRSANHFDIAILNGIGNTVIWYSLSRPIKNAANEHVPHKSIYN